MMDWITIALAFVLGIVAGVLVSSFLFESRLRFYKEFIEHRLESINRLRVQSSAAHKSSKPHWKELFGRHSKHDKDSNSSQN